MNKIVPKNQWTGPCHPNTMEAFDHIDAAMFSGDPAENRERYNYYRKYVDRWLKQLDECEPRLMEKENMMNITIEECLAKIDTMPDFFEKNQLRSLVRDLGYLGAVEYLKPLHWVNSGRDQTLANFHNKILQEILQEIASNPIMEKLCVEAYRAGHYRPLQDVINELREKINKGENMTELAKGTLVKVSQICGINVPLPAIGTINHRTNTGTEEWYSVNIIWEENVNYQCGECSTKHCRKEKNVRDCDVRRDWMELA